MSELINMSDDDILYCLQNLAGYEPCDIIDDAVEIAVNDDQFGEMSIVRTAQLGVELITKQAQQIKMLRDALNSLTQDYDSEEVAHHFGIDHDTAYKAVMALEDTETVEE